MAQIRELIDGKYEILKLIGRGGMSKVYLAMDTRLNKQWAIKEIEKVAENKNNDVVVQSLITEANLMKKLDHVSLPRIVDIIDVGKFIYVVMDYIEGEPLDRVLNEYGAQPQERVVNWALDLCDVLDYLHMNNPPIIYRDMKPGNVMLQPNGQLKLIDFGIAREYKQQNIADTVSLGTRGYAAPEQFGGKGQTDPRTDIYCLGVTLYHLVTGVNPSEPPYEIYPIRKWNPTLSSGLEKIITKCTQLNPEDRYQNIKELQKDLENYEKFDDEYLKNEKKQRRTFWISASFIIIFLVLGIFTNNLSKKLDIGNYENLIMSSTRSQNEEESIELLKEAIDLIPYRTEAYIAFVDIFKADAKFTVEEQELLNTLISSNLENLKKDEEFVDLAFEIGKTYWFYNDYGSEGDIDNSITRAVSSIYWFEEVVNNSDESYENYYMAEIYLNVGYFNRDIILNVEEASDKDLYGDYFESLVSVSAIITEEDRELVQLEGYNLITNSMETYNRKMKNDGVSEEDMVSLLNKIETALKETTPTTDKTKELKETIDHRVSRLYGLIEETFGEDE